MTDAPLPAGPGRRKDPAKRRAILDAAKQLFIRHGYDGSSMEAIASEAGVSKLTLYSHFADKEALFACAVEAKCAEQLPALIFALPDGGQIEPALLAIGLAFCQLVGSEESLALHRLMIAQASHAPELSQRFYQAGPHQLVLAMTRLLDHAQARNQLQLECSERAAEHFFCLLKGGQHLRQLIGIEAPATPAQRRQHVDGVVQLFLRAYRPTGTTGETPSASEPLSRP